MPIELPTLAACPRCGAIVLRTSRELVHPMPEERERIRCTLGAYWFQHEGTRFDGRLHRCVGCARQEGSANSDIPAGAADVSERSEQGERQTLRQELRNLWKALFAVSLACGIGGGSAWAADAPEAAAKELGPTQTPNSAASVHAQNDGPRAWRPARAVGPSAAAMSRLCAPDPTPTTPAGERQLRTAVIETANDFAGPSPSADGISRPAADFAEGRYQVVEVLSAGEPVVVFRAHDRNLGAEVVITEPTRRALDDPKFSSRFLREARALARLSHPHLVRITDVGEEGAAPFQVSESLPAGSLKFRRPLDAQGRPAPVSPAALLEWVGDIAEALDFLHAQGHIHRDVRPANLHFDANGQAYLAGLGKAAPLDETAKGTRAGRWDEISLTTTECAYIAPERIMGRACDGRADQYALAVIAYEMLSGSLPFENRTSSESLVLQASQDPPALHKRLPAIPKSLSDVVQRGLSRDPWRRYVTCMEFARAFAEAAQSGGTPAANAESADQVAALPAAGSARASAIGLATSLAAGLFTLLLLFMVGRHSRRAKSAKTASRPMPEPYAQNIPCETAVVRSEVNDGVPMDSTLPVLGTLENPLVLEPRGRANFSQPVSSDASNELVAAAEGSRMIARQERRAERMPAHVRLNWGEERLERFLATLDMIRARSRRQAADVATQERSLVHVKPRWRRDVKPTGTALAGIHHAAARALAVSSRRRAG